MKNWKTTVGGALLALGAMLQATKYHLIGNALAAIGGAILGTYSKDNNVTGGTVAATKEAEHRIDSAPSTK